MRLASPLIAGFFLLSGCALLVAQAQSTGTSSGLTVAPQLPANLFPSLSAVTATQDTTSQGPQVGPLSNVELATLAMSTPDYPVSPGDVYVLNYWQSVQSVTLALIVQSDFTINLGVFKTLDAHGMTFPELRKAVQDKVIAAYPASSPELVIRSIGVFPVLLRGEVQQTGYVQANGLTRLDALLSKQGPSTIFPPVPSTSTSVPSTSTSGSWVPYSSARNVEIRREDGADGRFDLFLALRKGDPSQNPYVRPGDTVIVHRAERIVQLQGAVRRPGTYELLAGDTLSSLIGEYGDGFTPQADPTNIRIERQGTAPGTPPQSLFVNASNATAGAQLEDQDLVYVPLRSALEPVVFFEGAVQIPKAGQGISTTITTTTSPGNYTVQGSDVIMEQFTPGDTLSYTLQKYNTYFLTTSDLAHGLVVRDGKASPVDMLRLMFYPNKDRSSDMVLEPFDRIVIPFKQQFVSVSGGVTFPGNYPYVPGNNYEYYLALAGGIDSSKHSGGDPVITDREGDRRPLNTSIQPQDRIDVTVNNPSITFGGVIAIIGGVASLTTIIYDIVLLAR